MEKGFFSRIVKTKESYLRFKTFKNYFYKLLSPIYSVAEVFYNHKLLLLMIMFPSISKKNDKMFF